MTALEQVGRVLVIHMCSIQKPVHVHMGWDTANLCSLLCTEERLAEFMLKCPDRAAGIPHAA